MTDFQKMTPRQTAQFTYMMDVMRRLEWDLHHRIEETGHIPREWHEIAQTRPTTRKVRAHLTLEEDVVKFFRALGPGYGPRINDVLKSYVHARLAGVIKGAETLNLFKERQELHAGPKPAFGDVARAMGKEWEDAPGEDTRASRLQRLQEAIAARNAAED